MAADRASPLGLLRQHELLSYCVATFGISWGGIAALLVSGSVALDAEHLALILGLGYVAMLAGPVIAAIALRALIDGRPGVRALRAAAIRWRVGLGWWMVALLTAPLSISALLWSLSLFSPAYVPRLVLEADPVALLQFVAVTAVLTGVFEEIGWTGSATPLLLRRHGVVRTGLILGLLMAVWNLPIVLLKELSVPTLGVVPLSLFLAVSLITWQTAYRVLLVIAYDRTRSVLLAMAMQTSLVAAWTSLTPLGLTQGKLMTFYIALAGLWCVVGLVALRGRDRRSVTRAIRAPRATTLRT